MLMKQNVFAFLCFIGKVTLVFAKLKWMVLMGFHLMEATMYETEKVKEIT